MRELHEGQPAAKYKQVLQARSEELIFEYLRSIFRSSSSTEFHILVITFDLPRRRYIFAKTVESTNDINVPM